MATLKTIKCFDKPRELGLSIDKAAWVTWAPTKRQLGKIARLVRMIEDRNKALAWYADKLSKMEFENKKLRLLIPDGRAGGESL
jgi:hypothetical protein